MVFFVLTVYVSCVYVPYALYVTSFTFDNGGEPSMANQGYALMASVVIGGNLTMYMICQVISEHMGFKYEDSREMAYLIMYTIAVYTNIVADVFITGYCSYKRLVAVRAHTYDGRRIEDITNIGDLLESYPVQKAFGYNLIYYCFPACFFAPFVAEGVAAILIPLHITKRLVRCHPEVQGRQAEKSFMFFLPMDMGRYADINLNITLTALILFAPPGYTFICLFCLLISNCYIYAYDHWRVLRAMGKFYYSTMKIDIASHRLNTVPCGIILGCLVFKGNCFSSGTYCHKSMNIIYISLAATLLHIVVHNLIISFVLPKIEKKVEAGIESDRTPLAYKEVAERHPQNWFNTNPVFCLRSKHFYKHSPPVDYCHKGKEHTMRKNEELGQYYDSPMQETKEDYSMC